MTSYKETTPRFSLKDELFHVQNVTELAKRIQGVYPDFKTRAFIKRVTGKFPDLELKERIDWIAHNFDFYIPKDYEETVAILLASLPPELDPELTDDDFGEFINAPYSHFVATRGCTKEHLTYSLAALTEMTKRFSVEGPIRDFINAFPHETFAYLEICSKDKNYHVRRLASEGTRAMLPWCHNITTDYKRPLTILNRLHADKTRYVTRSVANHMNDISKIDPALVIETLKKWKKEGRQNTQEMEFIIRHSLRTLINQGNTSALTLVGYKKPAIEVTHFQSKTKRVQIGDSYEFTLTLVSTSKKSQKLLVDYVLYFQKKNGELTPKTFKIKKIALAPHEEMVLHKKHPMKSMSTKTLYPGEHRVEIQINGERFGSLKFTLL